VSTNPLYLCQECVKDNRLKLYYTTTKIEKNKCSFCDKVHERCKNIDDNDELINLITALIRYHYSEELYNRHWGGEHLNVLLEVENELLEVSPTEDFEEALDVLICFLGNNYMENGNNVDLYYGHDNEGTRGCYFYSIKESKNHFLQALENDLLKYNYFLYEEKVNAHILPFMQYYEQNLAAGSQFYRARIGYHNRTSTEGFILPMINYFPYTNETIGAPDTKLVSGGRLNRPGVSFLYMATNVDTAINEVRPDPGHKVSIGTFKSTQDLRIVNFDKAFLDLCVTEESLGTFTSLNHIDQLFSHPITKDEREQYIITQFFADIFRKQGFDGIQFTSSVGSGKNILIFNPGHFVYVKDDVNKVYEVAKLQYTVNRLP